jgi:ABC-type Na+ efflux pump permease subunit
MSRIVEHLIAIGVAIVLLAAGGIWGYLGGTILDVTLVIAIFQWRKHRRGPRPVGHGRTLPTGPSEATVLSLLAVVAVVFLPSLFVGTFLYLAIPIAVMVGLLILAGMAALCGA